MDLDTKSKWTIIKLVNIPQKKKKKGTKAQRSHKSDTFKKRKQRKYAIATQ